jgi:AcrR family transcriptional regulator
MTTRLTREERRAQLVALGIEMIGASSFDEVSVDDVAAAAGISRSLLFHYFPTKRDFHVAVAAASADEFLAATAPDPSLPTAPQLRDSLERYFDYVGARRHAYVSLVRGATGGDDAMREVFDRTRQVIADRILAGFGTSRDDAPPLLQLAVRGWVAFAEEVSVAWLAGHGTSRAEVIDLLEQTLFDVVAGAVQVSDSSSPVGP